MLLVDHLVGAHLAVKERAAHDIVRQHIGEAGAFERIVRSRKVDALVNLRPQLLPQEILTPIIVIFCFTGAYSVNKSYFDVGVTLVFCAIAWLLRKIDFPAVPTLLDPVLGSMTETNFRRALQLSKRSISIFFSSPYCIAFVALTVFVVASLLYSRMKERRKKANEWPEAKHCRLLHRSAARGYLRHLRAEAAHHAASGSARWRRRAVRVGVLPTAGVRPVPRAVPDGQIPDADGVLPQQHHAAAKRQDPRQLHRGGGV